mmetsp:Transcript_60640/g.162305  ORF Transcript_60640/g.162305 Transcript_60640/m.162305 type:complete len:298 (+) Transcript_60640:106-999(+)
MSSGPSCHCPGSRWTGHGWNNGSLLSRDRAASPASPCSRPRRARRRGRSARRGLRGGQLSADDAEDVPLRAPLQGGPADHNYGAEAVRRSRHSLGLHSRVPVGPREAFPDRPGVQAAGRRALRREALHVEAVAMRVALEGPVHALGVGQVLCVLHACGPLRARDVAVRVALRRPVLADQLSRTEAITWPVGGPAAAVGVPALAGHDVVVAVALALLGHKVGISVREVLKVDLAGKLRISKQLLQCARHEGIAMRATSLPVELQLYCNCTDCQHRSSNDQAPTQMCRHGARAAGSPRR